MIKQTVSMNPNVGFQILGAAIGVHMFLAFSIVPILCEYKWIAYILAKIHKILTFLPMNSEQLFK